jgi:hypothetical protein
MIEITIAHDKVLNSLSDFEQLLFLKVLPHTDDYGRFDGDPEILKARVEPLTNRHISKYETAINNISKSGLWMRYRTPEGKLVIQFKVATFERINAFLVKKKGKPEFEEFKEGYELISSDMSLISHNKYTVESNKYKAKSKETRPENVDNIREYMRSIQCPEDQAQLFWDHFSSNGWKVGGKAPMLDWKAAVRNWNHRRKEEPSKQDPFQKFMEKHQ